MASTYAYMLSGYSGGGTAASAWRQDLGSGAWQRLADAPAAVAIISPNSAIRQQGGWDGSYWYAILLDGKLYRYNPALNSWSAALAGGAVLIGGVVEDAHWVMESDGRHVYLYGADGFRRYDPVGDAIEMLADGTTGVFDKNLFMVYDQNGNLYLTRGTAIGSIPFWQYAIATATWTQKANLPASFSGAFAGFASGGVFVYNGLQGLSSPSAYVYNPGSNSWVDRSGSGSSGSGQNVVSPWGFISDTTLRVWGSFNGGSTDYNIITNVWTSAAAPPFQITQSNSGVVGRTYNSSFTWYQADGTTLANPTTALGAAAVGETLTYHFRVKSTVARANGVRVNLATTPATDAEDAATLCGTAGGTYGTTFDTAALAAGGFFDVYVKVIPTSAQTLGFGKTFALTLTPL